MKNGGKTSKAAKNGKNGGKTVKQQKTEKKAKIILGAASKFFLAMGVPPKSATPFSLKFFSVNGGRGVLPHPTVEAQRASNSPSAQIAGTRAGQGGYRAARPAKTQDIRTNSDNPSPLTPLV